MKAKQYLISLEKEITDFFSFLYKKGYVENGLVLSNLNSDFSQILSLSDYPSLELSWLNPSLKKIIVLKTYLTNHGEVPIFIFKSLEKKSQFDFSDYFQLKYEKQGTFISIKGENNRERCRIYFNLIQSEMEGQLGKFLFTDFWEEIPRDWSPYK